MNRSVCILGAGNMGRALVGGLLRSGTRPEQLSVGEKTAATRELLAREFGVNASADNTQAAEGAAVVVLAVKPQDAVPTLAGLASVFARQRPLVVSVAAGIRIAALEAVCGPGITVVRAMPNRPALVGAGITGLYAASGISPAQRTSVASVLGSVGETVWVPTEEALDVVTAVSGSGPAYFFLLAELMAEAGERLGLEAPTARRLASATLYGSGLLAHAPDCDLKRSRTEVTSPGGTTEAALRVLESADLRTTVAQALGAAVRRSRELAAATSNTLTGA
ncbi:MAG TPA: pyrroline-5-carboxylate reductase [Steroidobacteraceae bacterium]